MVEKVLLVLPFLNESKSLVPAVLLCKLLKRGPETQEVLSPSLRVSSVVWHRAEWEESPSPDPAAGCRARAARGSGLLGGGSARRREQSGPLTPAPPTPHAGLLPLGPQGPDPTQLAESPPAHLIGSRNEPGLPASSAPSAHLPSSLLWPHRSSSDPCSYQLPTCPGSLHMPFPLPGTLFPYSFIHHLKPTHH